MTFLKQWATRDLGSAGVSCVYATARLKPNTEPTAGADSGPADTDAYAAWVAKNYSTTLRNSLNGTVTGYRCKFNFHQMWRWHKILKRGSQTHAHTTNGGLTNATRMAA